MDLSPFESLCVDLSCGEEVKSVDLGYFRALTPAQFMSLGNALKSAESLEVFKLKGAPSLGLVDVKYLANGVAENKTIKQLDFTNLGLGAAGVNQFSELINTCPALTTIFLGGNNINPPDAKNLSKSFKPNRTITALYLRRNQLGPEGAANLADSLTKMPLQLLDLRNNDIGAKGVRSINGLIKTCKTLEILFLDCNDIGNEGAKMIGQAIRRMDKLTTLYLRNNKIKGDGAQLVAEGLMINKSIQTLQMGGNPLGLMGAKYFKDALIEQNRTLKNLGLGSCEIGNEGCTSIAAIMSAQGCALDTLNIYGNKITLKGAKTLANGIRINKSLTMLDLGVNQLGPDGVEFITKAMEKNSSITLLDLRGNRIFDEGAQCVSEMLTTNTTIRSIKLSTNNITDVGIQALAGCLRTNTSLKSLNISMNKVRTPGVKSLLEAVRSANGEHSLSDISIRGCPTVDPLIKEELHKEFEINPHWGLAHSVVPEEVSDGESSDVEEKGEEGEEGEEDEDGEDGEEGEEVPVEQRLTPRGRGEDTVKARKFSKAVDDGEDGEQPALVTSPTPTSPGASEAPTSAQTSPAASPAPTSPAASPAP